jgi:excisionase family DNA binding protein
MSRRPTVNIPQPTTASHTLRLTYSVKEVAHLTGLSVRSVRYLLQSGRLGFVRIGRRQLIRHADVEALLRRHYVKPIAPVDAGAHIRPDTNERKC